LRDGFAIHRTCNLFPNWPWPSTSRPRGESSFERISRELVEEHASEFSSLRAAELTRQQLPEFLMRLCLDPRIHLGSDNILPSWPKVIERLQAYRQRFCAAASERVVQTEVTKTIFELLDYARRQRGIVLGLGTYRIGKSLSAQAWCQMHLGEARYCQL